MIFWVLVIRVPPRIERRDGVFFPIMTGLDYGRFRGGGARNGREGISMFGGAGH